METIKNRRTLLESHSLFLFSFLVKLSVLTQCIHGFLDSISPSNLSEFQTDTMCMYTMYFKFREHSFLCDFECRMVLPRCSRHV
ncbi:hypothetical protein K435DRAFT_520103 [Dendrothele bispora CBS 962.96]|uniref:Uncharacterized protein n=1 Tax=Dendrothele bispora (strain CBS 962.96) TaxID=1314807 RepID=A0A4S8M8X4_DENBC|nr:hypothetical protein K435DRAFT_520103 [Dendrothele bispora CBS 962.96]